MSQHQLQKLVDITFSIGLTIREQMDKKRVARTFKSQEETAAWIADQLRGCGFDTIPLGASWGHLKEK